MPLNIHLIDLVIIITYFIICLGIGIYNAKRVKTLQHFALGIGNAPIAILLCVIFASSIGAGSVVGSTEKVFILGIIFVIGELLKPLQWLVAAKIIAPNIEKFKGCITISQIMHKLYGNAGRWVTNIASILMGLSFIAAQASAIGLVFHYFLGIDFTDGILISYIVLTTYSMLGGIKAIIPTEIFKTIIFLVILPISYMKSSTDMGSIQEVFNKLPPSHLHIELTSEVIITIISFILFSLLPGINSPLVQRYLMAPSAKELRKTFIYLACLSLPFYIMICVIAYTVKALAPGITANEAFLYYISHFLPAGIKGLMIAGLMAIIMSLAESWLNSTSVIIVNDIIKVWFPKISDSKQLLALRLTVPILSLASIFIVLYNKNILEVIWFIYNFWDPLIAIPMYAGFLGFKANSRSFMASVLLAIMFAIIGRTATGEFAIVSYSFGILTRVMDKEGKQVFSKMVYFF
jgi:Na+/proline symporter